MEDEGGKKASVNTTYISNQLLIIPNEKTFSASPRSDAFVLYIPYKVMPPNVMVCSMRQLDSLFNLPTLLNSGDT